VAVLEVAGATLAYDIAPGLRSGNDQPVLTFLHGFSHRGSTWREMIDRLGPGVSWVTVDLRGHGATATEPGAAHTMEACTGDVVRLWEHLGIARTHLVGYSMGARLALHIATHRPERLETLVVIAGAAGLAEPGRSERLREDGDLAGKIEAEGVGWFADHWAALPMFAGLAARGEATLSELRRVRLGNRPEGLAASLRDMGQGAMAPLWDLLPRLQMPVLLIAGEQDPRLEVTRRLHAAIPQSRLRVVQGAGHAVQLEAPEEVAMEIGRWIESHQMTSASAHSSA
jgi:2-succinyl-6-hydroxy-2,4-cyclohexadiene-1-carboxylate synthase